MYIQDEIVLLQRQLCDYLARQSLFSKALDVFTSLSKLPNTHWQTVLIDWIKIKKRARLASDDSITSRSLRKALQDEMPEGAGILARRGRCHLRRRRPRRTMPAARAAAA